MNIKVFLTNNNTNIKIFTNSTSGPNLAPKVYIGDKSVYDTSSSTTLYVYKILDLTYVDDIHHSIYGFNYN